MQSSVPTSSTFFFREQPAVDVYRDGSFFIDQVDHTQSTFVQLHLPESEDSSPTVHPHAISRLDDVRTPTTPSSMSTLETPREPQGTQVFTTTTDRSAAETFFDGEGDGGDGSSVVVHDDVPSSACVSPLWRQMGEESAFSSTANGCQRRRFQLSDLSTDDPTIRPHLEASPGAGGAATGLRARLQKHGELTVEVVVESQPQPKSEQERHTTEGAASKTGTSLSLASPDNACASSPSGATLASQGTGNSSTEAFRKMADAMLEEVEEELDCVTAHRDRLARELAWHKTQHKDQAAQIESLSEENARLKQELLLQRMGTSPAPSSQSLQAPPAWWAAAKADLLQELVGISNSTATATRPAPAHGTHVDPSDHA